MSEGPPVLCFTVKVPNVDLLGKPFYEEQARIGFRHYHGVEADTVTWYYEAAHQWEDPDTGEVLNVPEMHMVLAEAMSNKKEES